MSNTNPADDQRLSRRKLLQVSGGAAGLLGMGAVPALADDDSAERDFCSETTLGPSMVHYDDSIQEVCADDHPETEQRQAAVKESLAENYSTVGALIDAGYIPYLDFLDDGSWAHWINPEFLGDEETLDPERPESILVDNNFWRPIGVMYIATSEGEDVDPPTVYEDDDGACTPWHAHVGLPGRLAWFKYQAAYQDSASFACRTPWVMHVWRYSHEESVYAHDAPEERGGSPAEEPGFDTDADPTEEKLGPEHLPDALRDKATDIW